MAGKRGLGTANKEGKAGDCGGGRGGSWLAGAHNKDTSNRRLAEGVPLKLIPNERKQKRCGRCLIDKMGGGGLKKAVKGEPGRGRSLQWLQHGLGSQELPGLSLICTHSFRRILGFGVLAVWIIPSGAQGKYVKMLIKIHKRTATENNHYIKLPLKCQAQWPFPEGKPD